MTARPFAFLATFSSGFGAGGRLKHLPLRNAVQQYAGANDRAALINLLSPVEEAAKACAWVRELADSGDLYRPLAWSPELAYRFLQSVPELERSGLSVRVPNWWRKRPRPQVSVTIGSQTPPRVGADAVLDFRVEVALGDSPLSAEELEALRSAGDGLVSAPQPVGGGGPRATGAGDRTLGNAATPRRRRRDLVHRGHAPAGGRFGRSPAGGPDRGRPSLGAGHGRRGAAHAAGPVCAGPAP